MPSGRFTLLLLAPAYAYLPPSLSLRTSLCRPTLFHPLFCALPALPLLLPSIPPSPSRRQSFPLPSCVSHCSHDSILLWISHAQTKTNKNRLPCSRSSSYRFDAVGEFYGFLEFFWNEFLVASSRDRVGIEYSRAFRFVLLGLAFCFCFSLSLSCSSSCVLLFFPFFLSIIFLLEDCHFPPFWLTMMWAKTVKRVADARGWWSKKKKKRTDCITTGVIFFRFLSFSPSTVIDLSFS